FSSLVTSGCVWLCVCVCLCVCVSHRMASPHYTVQPGVGMTLLWSYFWREEHPYWPGPRYTHIHTVHTHSTHTQYTHPHIPEEPHRHSHTHTHTQQTNSRPPERLYRIHARIRISCSLGYEVFPGRCCQWCP